MLLWNNLFRNERELFYKTTLQDHISKKSQLSSATYIVNHSSSNSLPGEPLKTLWINCRAFWFSSSPAYSKTANHSSMWRQGYYSIKGSNSICQNPPWLHARNTEHSWWCWRGWYNSFGNWYLWEPISPFWNYRSGEATALGHYFTQGQLFQMSGLGQLEGR